MNQDSLLSKTITWLRFPLIVLVVFIHIPCGPETLEIKDFPAANFVCENLLQGGIARVAVPLFFFISGFLYFFKTEWSFPAFAKKLRSRAQTILVPFAVWSLLCVAYIILVYKLGLTRGTVCAENHSLADWLKNIYGIEYGENAKTAYPLLVPFWFLRDLFVVGLFAPLWHFLLKNKIAGTLFLAALAAIWFAYQGKQIPGFSTTAVFFFCAGAYFSIHGRDFTADFAKIGAGATCVYFPLLVVDVLTKECAANWWINHAFIVVSVVAVVFWVSRGIAAGKLKESAFLSGATFMVYAGHAAAFFVSPTEKLFTCLYVPVSSAEIIVVFFAKSAFQIAFWLGIYQIARRFFPWTLRFLTGGR